MVALQHGPLPIGTLARRKVSYSRSRSRRPSPTKKCCSTAMPLCRNSSWQWTFSGRNWARWFFSFRFFSRRVFRDRHEFLDRLIPFLKKLPHSYQFAIEIRNRDWLDADLANLLRDHRIALVLQDRFWMPSPSELRFDPITADWTYIRWLGDRKGIEEETTTWNETVVDSTEELTSWVDDGRRPVTRVMVIGVRVDYDAAFLHLVAKEQFRNLWQARGFPELAKPRRSQREGLLFPI